MYELMTNDWNLKPTRTKTHRQPHITPVWLYVRCCTDVWVS